MAWLPNDSWLLFIFLAMTVEIIPFDQIMRLYFKNEFIVSFLNACHIFLCILHS